MDKIKVLVIDDKRIIGDLFEFTLGYSGHAITAVNNPKEGLDLIRREKFDVIFLDIIMPGRDGVSVLEELKQISPDVPVVMMSGYSVEEKRNRVKELGAVTCLKKPFEMDDVRKIVKEALGKEI